MSVFMEKNGIFDGAKPCANRLEPVVFQPDSSLCVASPKRGSHVLKHISIDILPGKSLIFGFNQLIPRILHAF
ncbi:MAG: hypothetical protein JXM79_14685 [Sedimentisphaerales bacterium]|nr:hypothetical protein [Sedimentisphaerales bacterium]